LRRWVGAAEGGIIAEGELIHRDEGDKRDGRRREN
jgi:hypothetical protein